VKIYSEIGMDDSEDLSAAAEHAGASGYRERTTVCWRAARFETILVVAISGVADGHHQSTVGSWLYHPGCGKCSGVGSTALERHTEIALFYPTSLARRNERL